MIERFTNGLFYNQILSARLLAMHNWIRSNKATLNK